MSIKREYNFDSVGEKDMYLLHHEELESLAVNIPEVKRIRFFMTFGQSYLTHMKCLENVGMLSTTPVNFEGHEIVPIKFLKELLRTLQALATYTRKNQYRCIFTGKKDGKDKTTIFIMCATIRNVTKKWKVRQSALRPAYQHVRRVNASDKEMG